MAVADHPPSLDSREAILWRVSLASIERFLLPDSGILSRRLTSDASGVSVLSEPSPRNTAEVVKSMYVVRRRGFPCPLDPDALLERLISQYLPELEYPDVSLLLWADALGDGTRGSELGDILIQRLPAKASETMYLGWALAACCHALRKAPDLERLATLAHGLYGRVSAIQATKTGLFRTSGARTGLLRRREAVTTLPAQASAIHALALYGNVFGVADAADRAGRCAEVLCRLQGPLGQWWWSYDAARAQVVDRYPVYSVAQDASVPMALELLGTESAPALFRDNVSRGVAWLFGDNELSESFVDEDQNIIWRALDSHADGFRVVREMYSYHAARCLCWLAARA